MPKQPIIPKSSPKAELSRMETLGLKAKELELVLLWVIGLALDFALGLGLAWALELARV